MQTHTGHLHSLKIDRLWVLGKRQRDSWWQEKCSCSTCLKMSQLRLQIYPIVPCTEYFGLDASVLKVQSAADALLHHRSSAEPMWKCCDRPNHSQSSGKIFHSFWFFQLLRKHETFITLSPNPTSFQEVNTLAAMSEFAQKNPLSSFFITCYFWDGCLTKFFVKTLFFCLFKPGDTAPTNIPPCAALKHKLHPGSHNTVNNKCFIFITLWIINSRFCWHHGFHQKRCIKWGG